MTKYLTVADVMNALHISRSAVYSLFKRENFPATRIGRRLLISEDALEEFLGRGGTDGELLMPMTKK